MKFAQIHYFLSQNVGGDKRYYVPPINSVPGYWYGLVWISSENLVGLVLSWMVTHEQ